MKMRKIFEVLIQDKPYDVYDVAGKDHMGLNDSPKSWWLYYAERLPDGLLPSPESSDFVPYCCKSLNRSCWELKFKENNTSKFKWDDWMFSHGCGVQMWCNGKEVYTFRTRNIEFAMAKAQYLMVLMSEHPYNFFDQQSENGRKICFYGLPATIRVSSHPGEIGIVPDYSTVPKGQWWNEYEKRRADVIPQDDEWEEMEKEDNEEYKGDDYINWGDALSDGHINWFRK